MNVEERGRNQNRADCKTSRVYEVSYRYGANERGEALELKQKIEDRSYVLSGVCCCGKQSFKIHFFSKSRISHLSDYLCDTPSCETHNIFTDVEIENIELSNFGKMWKHSHSCKEQYMEAGHGTVTFVNPTFSCEITESLLIRLSLTNVDHKLAIFWKKAYFNLKNEWSSKKARRADRMHDEAMIHVVEIDKVFGIIKGKNGDVEERDGSKK